MPLIVLETLIDAPIERVFDLARSINLHIATTGNTQERAIAGRTSGLIERGETVTWEARHFGVRQQLQSEITALEYPVMFEDTMLQGVFKSLRHVHSFHCRDGLVLMRDEFHYQAPLGLLGSIAEVLVLTRYLRQFVEKKNTELKAVAESERWRQYLVSDANT